MTKKHVMRDEFGIVRDKKGRLDLDYEPNIICDTANMTRQEWLELRSGETLKKDKKSPFFTPFTIGGSDCAKMMGVSPYESEVGLWRKKLGIKDVFEIPNDFSKEKTLNRGNILEPVVAQLAVLIPGFENAIIEEDSNFYQHPYHRFMVGNIDRIMRHNGERSIVEIKTVSWKNKDAVEDYKNGVVPIHYELQLRWYMAIKNINVGYILVAWDLMNPEDGMRFIRIERDLEIEEKLVKKGHEFITKLLNRVEPVYANSDPEVVMEEYRRRYPAEKTGVVVDIDISLYEKISELRDLVNKKSAAASKARKDEKEYKTRIDEIMGTLVDYIQGNDGMKCGDIEFSYAATVRSGGFDAEKLEKLFPEAYEKTKKETVFRTLKLVEKKEGKKK